MNAPTPARKMVPGDIFPCTHHRMTKKCPDCSREEPAMPTPARSEMVEKVAQESERYHEGPMASHPLTTAVIAAVFDNLPRDVMARDLKKRVGLPCSQVWYEEIIDAAISAARREVLGHE